MPRDGTIEDLAREADGFNNIRVACTNYPDPSLVTNPVVLVLLNSISQIYVAPTYDVPVLHHVIFPPT